MAVSCANAQYGYQYFGQRSKEPVLFFRQRMAYDLIFNRWVPEEFRNSEEQQRKSRKRPKIHHCKFVNIPLFKVFKGPELVSCSGKYNRRLCSCEKKRTRTFCQCSPGIYRCPECYATHLEEVANAYMMQEPNLAKI